MNGRIDVHSHLLPGVDDGCASLEESIECARGLVAAGYTHSFCTPHIWPNLRENTVENIARWTKSLQDELDRAGIPLKLLPGGELNLAPWLLELRSEQIVTYGLNRKYALFDLWADRMPDFFEPGVRWLQSLGLTTILAHPERMRMIQDEPELADRLEEMGVLLQGNLQCLVDRSGAHTRQVAERYLLEDRYFLLGSDLHQLRTLPVRLAGLERAIELVGRERVDRLTRENPRRLLADP